MLQSSHNLSIKKLFPLEHLSIISDMDTEPNAFNYLEVDSLLNGYWGTETICDSAEHRLKVIDYCSLTADADGVHAGASPSEVMRKTAIQRDLPNPYHFR